MENSDLGRVTASPGSREPSPKGLGPAGFDPSRLSQLCCDIANARYALEFWHRETDPRMTNNWRGLERARERGLQEIRQLLYWDEIIRPIAYPRDRDGSGEADETGTGSAAGDSPGRKASPEPVGLNTSSQEKGE